MLWDIAKILYIAVFFNLFNDLLIAELSQAGNDGDGDGGASGLAVSAFVGVVERGEAINDGLPRNQAAQEDKLVSGIVQVRLDPLSRKRVLKRMCYHGVDLFEELRDVAIPCRQRYYLTLGGH